MLKGLCHGCFLHFLYYANYALPWSRRFFLKFFGFATEGANREAATTSRDYNRFFQTVPGKTNWKFFSVSRKREQAGKRRQRVAIIIVSFKQFQVKQTEISWKSSKSGGTQPCNTHEIGFDFDASKSLGGGRYNDDCFGFHLCSELWTWMLQFDKQDL